MDNYWSRRSLPAQRWPVSQRGSGRLLATRGASGLALALVLALGGVSKADVDLTGDWYLALPSQVQPNVSLHSIVQSGTSLQMDGLSGVIDPSTGRFSFQLVSCTFNSLCPFCLARAQASPDGNTFAGELYTYGPPPDCHSPTCACSVSFLVGPWYGSRSPCGDGVVDPGEACDNANLGRNADCCMLGCSLAPVGQACASDGTPCTNDVCDAAGTCTHPSAPRTCRMAEKSLLLVKGDTARHKLVWKWVKGAPTSQAEFGVPTGTTGYALCIFAATASTLVDEAVIPAGPTTWRTSRAKGYTYKDPAATADGIDKVVLRGSTENKSKVKVHGKQAGLPDLPLPLTAPVIVQLVNGDNGLCWGASYTAAQLLENRTGRLKAKAP